jgi:hypothetical protein
LQHTHPHTNKAWPLTIQKSLQNKASTKKTSSPTTQKFAHNKRQLAKKNTKENVAKQTFTKPFCYKPHEKIATKQSFTNFV